MPSTYKEYLKDVVRKDNIQDKTRYKHVLSQNERNFPIEIISSFFDSLTQQDITFYPNVEKLKNKIKNYSGAENILLVPGSDIGIKTVFDLFELKNKDILTTGYYFPMYKVYADLSQANLIPIPYTNFNFNLNSLTESITDNTGLIIFANPNSPIGDTYSIDNIKKVLDTGICTVVDEAYIELSHQPSCISLLKEYDNLFVLRTFSKGLGAAGCRVGYICTSKHNLEYLEKLRFMYEVSSISCKYAEFVLDNIDYFNSYLKSLLEEKSKFIDYLRKHFNLKIHDTQTSWFFLEKNNITAKMILDNNIDIRTIQIDFFENVEWYKFNYDLSLTSDTFIYKK